MFFYPILKPNEYYKSILKPNELLLAVYKYSSFLANTQTQWVYGRNYYFGEMA